MTSRRTASSPVTVSGHPIRHRWREAVEGVLDSHCRRILVIGPADAGKSTFCLMLLEAMWGAGREARLLDADVGQKLTGPPACVTVGRSSSGPTVACSQLCFVGATSPVAGWRRLVHCLAAHVGQPGDHTVVVNTSGLLSGPGQRLKDQKIGVVQPDLVVAIGNDPHLVPIIARQAGPVIHRLASAPERRRKTSAERAAARRTAFSSYFCGSRRWRLAPSDVEWETASRGIAPPPGLLVGLSDPHGRDLALAIVLDSEASGDLMLLSPIPPAGLRLRPGRIRLNDEFQESALEP